VSWDALAGHVTVWWHPLDPEYRTPTVLSALEAFVDRYYREGCACHFFAFEEPRRVVAIATRGGHHGGSVSIPV
jgi:hypothetical protein